MTTAFPTSLILGAYIPIFPEHIWKDVTFDYASTDSVDYVPTPTTS